MSKENFTIYLSGGMSNLTWKEQTEWRYIIQRLFQKYDNERELKYKLSFFDPTKYYNFQEKLYDTELEVMKFDLYNLQKSDLIFVNFNNPNSIGTAQELAIAWNNQIPIIGYKNSSLSLHPWLIEQCDKTFNDIPKAVDYIVNFYLM